MANSKPITVKLYFTLSDGKYIYMFMEACLGGELWVSLKANKRFTEPRTQFYVACIVEAIEVVTGLLNKIT